MAHDLSCGARRTLTALLLGCTALIAAPTLAQDSGAGTEESPYRLSPILINADAQADDDANSVVARELWVGGKVATSILDTPASVSVVTEKEVRDRDADTLEEVLSYSAGIHTDYYGTDDRNEYFLVRGFQATTYRDGLTLGSMRGAREEPYAYERTEVIRGGNSTLFGTSDPGGTINFVTKQPRFERFGEVYGSVGSPRNAEYGFDAGDVLNAEGTLAYRLTGKVQDGERDYDHSRNDSRFLMGGLSWQPTTATKLSVVADYLKRENTPNSGGYPLDREYDRDDFFGEPDFNFQNVERSSITGLLEHDFGNGLNLRANLRYSDLKSDFGYVYLFDYAGRPGTSVSRYYFGGDNTAEELIGNVILQYDRSFDRFDSSTLAGLEFRDASTTEAPFYGLYTPIDVANPVYSGAPGELASPYQFRDNDYKTQSLFVQQNVSFNDQFIATVGLRHDWLDITSTGWDDFDGDGNRDAYKASGDHSETSVRGALTWKINTEFSTYVSYVESVAPPGVGAEPERGEQYELGVKYQPLGTTALISASVYDLRKNNVSVSVTDPDTGNITRELVGEQRVRGIDLEAKAELANNVDVIASYSWMESEVLRSDPIRGQDVEGNEFSEVPNHLASLWVNYTLAGNETRGDMTFGLGARYVGSYYFAISNATGKADASVTLDAAFTYQVQDNTSLAVNVSNLLDDQHVVGRGTADYYNPGREVAVTLRHTF
ncbi:TonB-dependent siderophore receptor [Paracoccus shandongensis]|uniref:TonB-dependent siderophore receptor n=1 Tax=Paracoccus shandongensis TaxID=2816048 RepID=UPI001A8E5847|nr:TonB-dependent siderophore receptor [Paracoccus shandongensis]